MTEHDRASRLTEAIASFLDASERGDRPEREAFLALYPEIREELGAFLERYDAMESLAGPLRELACIGPLPEPLGRFGQYELLSVIDGGGMGVVYRARQTSLNREVALKISRAGRSATAEELENFRAEARAAAAMRHPNIVPIHDCDELHGQLFFTMDLIEGGPLAWDARDFQNDPMEAARLISVVARAIAHAHDRNVIHRDLKPGNILIDPDGVPHVADFGLAMVLKGKAGLTDPDHLVGTLPYMAPEQLSETAQPLTHRVDIWALGAILYELLTGRTPFQGENQEDTIDRIRHADAVPMRALNPLVSRDLERICMRCLRRTPEERCDSALALAEDLERWLSGEAAQMERYLAEARRRELRKELQYISGMVADRVLMRLREWSGAVVDVANDRGLPDALKGKDATALRDLLERVRRSYDDPSRGLADMDGRSPFETWTLFDERGVVVACSPEGPIVGRDLSRRDWFRGAVEHAGKRGLDSVHVSRIFLSLVSSNQYKLVISAPVCGADGSEARVLGVVAASFTTDSSLGHPGLFNDLLKVVVVGRGDPDSSGGDEPADHLVLVHPAYRKGEEAAKIASPALRSFLCRPNRGELRMPEPGQGTVVDEAFEDPMAGKDPRFQGLWWAGIAPVGNTHLLAIVQRRPDPLVKREAEIVVGQLIDFTGATGSVGEPYARGIEAYADFLNARGGINGKRLRLVQLDYANRPEQAARFYDRFRTVDRVLAIHGWGTGDTEILSERATQDQIPFFSGSCSALLSDPGRAPYNFISSTDYSTQLRAGLRHLREGWNESRKPRIAFVFPDHPYGKSPVQAGREYARELGFEIAGEVHVDLKARRPAAEIERLGRLDPDFTWIGGTTPSAAEILMEARRQGLRTRFLVNLWGNDEDLIQLAGSAVEGVLGLQGSVLFGDDVPGMKALREATRGESRTTHFLRGWVSMRILCEGLERAEEEGELNGPGIKRALESLREFDPDGLTPPLTITAADHRPSMSVLVYEYAGGGMRYRRTVTLERRPEWLGF
jgi:branched-chain amino acid transport system substrate-binding protein